MKPIRQAALVLVILAIVGSIWYLQSLKKTFLPGSGATIASPATGETAADKAKKYPLAKEITSPDGFINSDPFKIADLIGKKVILVDFWTYSCINCQRTIPYLNSWYDKYKDKGLEIIGVHTPEFQFEENLDNVTAAVAKYGIKYPVVLDNEHGTWNAYGNLYWPREYLIDIDGYIVHDHAGEGDYDVTEKAIQAALDERAARLGETGVSDMPVGPTEPVVTPDFGKIGSPETYFGSNRNEYLGNGRQSVSGEQTLTAPAAPALNTLYLDGTWNFSPEFATNSSSGAKILYEFNSKDVYFVGSADKPVRMQILIDGKPVGAAAGADVDADGYVTVSEDRLYHLVDEPAGYGQHTLEIIIESPGVDAYTFTFG